MTGFFRRFFAFDKFTLFIYFIVFRKKKLFLWISGKICCFWLCALKIENLHLSPSEKSLEVSSPSEGKLKEINSRIFSFTRRMSCNGVCAEVTRGAWECPFKSFSSSPDDLIFFNPPQVTSPLRHGPLIIYDACCQQTMQKFSGIRERWKVISSSKSLFRLGIVLLWDFSLGWN